MKVYRLESLITGGGPFFDLGPKTPNEWRNTHEPPDSGRTISSKVFKKWRERNNLHQNGRKLPKRYKFSFTTIEQLIDCFPGFEDLPHFRLKEYEINPKRDKDYCILPDGQIVFSYTTVISSCVIKF